MQAFLNLPRVQKQAIAATVDLICLPATFALAVLLRYDGVSRELFQQYLWLIVAAPLVSIPIFVKLGFYRAVVRFIDQKIVYVAVLGVTLSVVVLFAAVSFLHIPNMSRGVFVIYWISAILYIVSSRFLARGWLLRSANRRLGVRVAVYGAGKAGMQLASAMRAGYEYLPVAFIDDKQELQGATISGIKVHASKNLPTLVEKLEIQEVLLAMPNVSKAEQKRILEQLEPLKIKIKVTPPIDNLFAGKLRLEDVREIEVEDLLGRDTVAPDPSLISHCIAGKVVMVTGAGGSIGSELCRQIAILRPARLLLFDLSEYALYSIEQELIALSKRLNLGLQVLPFIGSVEDFERCREIMSTFEVGTVYHAAAYKHVPLVEHNPIAGIRNNVFGTLSVVKAAIASNVNHFVLISTDKAVRPTNVMGATKRLAELILQAFALEGGTTVLCMVRFGNVLGSSGSVVPLFRKQIMEGGPITVTHPEITRYFMTIPEAAQLVLQAGSMATGGDVFVLDMGEPVKITDLAKRMVHLSGLEVRSEATPDGTIEIQHVGLRPGEKLYEELLIGANVEGTHHPLIMRAQETAFPWCNLNELLLKLDSACAKVDHERIRDILLLTVAEYSPQGGIEDFAWVERNRYKGTPHSSPLALVQ